MIEKTSIDSLGGVRLVEDLAEPPLSERGMLEVNVI